MRCFFFSQPFRAYHPAIKALVLMLPISLTVFLHNFVVKPPSDLHQLLFEYYHDVIPNFTNVLEFVWISPAQEEATFRLPALLLFLLTLTIAKKYPDKKFLKFIGYTLTVLVLTIMTWWWASKHHHYFITVFGYGLVWGWLMLRMRSLIYPIIFHAGSNAIALVSIAVGYHLIY